MKGEVGIAVQKFILVKKIIAAVEPALKNAPQQVAMNAQVRIVSLLTKAKSHILMSRPKGASPYAGSTTTLIIVPSDKLCATVVLDRNDYNKKLQAMLDDPHTYEKITKDPTFSLEWQMNAVLLSLNKEGAVPDKLHQMLQSSVGRTPPLYGFLKIHKPDVLHSPIIFHLVT